MSDIVATLKGINAGSFETVEEMRKGVIEAHALLSRIESPWETASRLAMTIPTQMAAWKAANDMGLFQKWLQKNNGHKDGTDELSGLVESDPELLRRLLRRLAATNMLWVDKQGLYEMTPFAISLVEEEMASAVDYFFQLGISAPVLEMVPGDLRPDRSGAGCERVAASECGIRVMIFCFHHSHATANAVVMVVGWGVVSRAVPLFGAIPFS